MRHLLTFNGYTIDLRLKQARLVNLKAFGGIEFHDLDYRDSEQAAFIRDELLTFCKAVLLTLT